MMTAKNDEHLFKCDGHTHKPDKLQHSNKSPLQKPSLEMWIYLSLSIRIGKRKKGVGVEFRNQQNEKYSIENVGFRNKFIHVP